MTSFPPEPGAGLSNLRPHAHSRSNRGDGDCPACGAIAALRGGRCSMCGESIAGTGEPGILSRLLNRIRRRSS